MSVEIILFGEWFPWGDVPWACSAFSCCTRLTTSGAAAQLWLSFSYVTYRFKIFTPLQYHRRAHTGFVSWCRFEYLFNFDNTFEIHDDIEVLKRMGMSFGLESGKCSLEDLKLAKSLVPKALEGYITGMFTKAFTCAPWSQTLTCKPFIENESLPSAHPGFCASLLTFKCSPLEFLFSIACFSLDTNTHKVETIYYFVWPTSDFYINGIVGIYS